MLTTRVKRVKNIDWLIYYARGLNLVPNYIPDSQVIKYLGCKGRRLHIGKETVISTKSGEAYYEAYY